jgi:hypothetical protein
MRPLIAALLLSCCATPQSAELPGEVCERTYQRCNNACFRPPNYKRNGPQCVQGAGALMLCPQQDQVLDTVEAAKCFDSCESAAKLCRT